MIELYFRFPWSIWTKIKVKLISRDLREHRRTTGLCIVLVIVAIVGSIFEADQCSARFSPRSMRYSSLLCLFLLLLPASLILKIYSFGILLARNADDDNDDVVTLENVAIFQVFFLYRSHIILSHVLSDICIILYCYTQIFWILANYCKCIEYTLKGYSLV